MWMDNPSKSMVILPTRRLAILIILSALCLSIQLTPRPIPNFEFTSLLVFLVGAFFGTIVGGALGATIMLINGFLSPWGFSGLNMPFQIVGMALMGAGGGLYGRTKKGAYALSSSGETAILGAFFTLVFDLITNFGFALQLMLSGVPALPTFISVLISGALFSVVHVVSNFFIFLIIFFPLIRALQEFFGGENIWKKESLPT
jgi:hypothetical protein